ncbi:MAG: putative toxin-antitoxin system toxin component, PIN family [Proteobacteria bacterium]|nr:putative toxin-antitoxin system toxin component, PIN family [Pseudomonadota bacterium]
MTLPEQLADSAKPAPPPAVVLDTNVVLDWLLFRDPTCNLLAERITAGRLRWLATPAMRNELAHVLDRCTLAAWSPDIDALLACWDRWAEAVPDAQPADTPRCRDPDDQKFIDTALAAGARWLLSRDKALLQLAGAARRASLVIATPRAWSAAAAATAETPAR